MHILFVRFSYVHPYVRAFQKIESITFIHNAHIFLWVLLTMTRFSFSSPPKLFGGSLFFNVLNSASWCRSVVEKVLFIPEMFPDVLNEISSNFYRMEETSKRRERQKKVQNTNCTYYVQYETMEKFDCTFTQRTLCTLCTTYTFYVITPNRVYHSIT